MKRWLLLFTAAGLAGAAPAWAERFEIRPDKRNLVRFESRAPMETFEGKTRQVSGYVEFDPRSLPDSAVILVEVDLASLDTGIPLRNRHMRENHLDTAQYPKAVFRGGRLESEGHPSLVPGQSAAFRVSGKFELHGVTRDITVPVEATRLDDGSLHLVSRFEVKLSDYRISRPQFLLLKLDETQRITFDVRAAAS
jgi:polyisoprenoid-binding protein YceI